MGGTPQGRLRPRRDVTGFEPVGKEVKTPHESQEVEDPNGIALWTVAVGPVVRTAVLGVYAKTAGLSCVTRSIAL